MLQFFSVVKEKMAMLFAVIIFLFFLAYTIFA